MSDLEAGWAARDITPPVGVWMGGYWGRPAPAQAVQDSLAARALVWRVRDQIAGVVSLDLIAVTAEMTNRIRRQISVQTGMAVSALMVCCTHSHAGPLTIPFRGMGTMDADYIQRVEEETVAAVEHAVEALVPVAMCWGKASVEIAENRRCLRVGNRAASRLSGETVSHWAHVLRFETAEGDLASLVQHACHPVVLGADNVDISAEYPGVAVREIKAATGGFAMFVNGACGDINPVHTNADYAQVEVIGRMLAASVLDAETVPMTVSSLASSTQPVDLPLQDPPTRSRAWVIRIRHELGSALKALSLPGQVAMQVPRAHRDWARELTRVAGRGGGGGVQPFEVQAIRLGPVRLVGLEGEIFLRYQLDLEADSETPLLVCGFANGCVGYVPTTAEFALGGYEVDEAYVVYPSVLMLAPKCEAVLRQGIAKVLEAVSD
ncbi:MAG: hypothetical protein VX733_02210 [Candidatus Latescibacterota bacterium]|nr:hypothetical protein [Candidatus Latescibacterota bacterium]